MRLVSLHTRIESLTALAATLLIVGVAACGEARMTVAGSRTRTVPQAKEAADRVPASSNRLKDDEDEDGAAATSKEHVGTGADTDADSSSAAYYDWDDGNVLYYGHAANAADARAVTTAVRRYYATAARGDGAAVCRLLSSSMARSVPRSYGDSVGLPALRGKTCASVMSKVLQELHQQMSTDNAALKVGVVRVEGATAEALIGFRPAWPDSYTVLRREHKAWKMTELLPGELP